MHCKSLWIKVSAKFINVNVNVLLQGTVHQGHSVHIGCECSAFPSHLIDWQWYWNWLNIININITSFIFLALTNYVEGTCYLGTCLSKLIKVKLSEDLYCFNYFLHAWQILYVGHVYLLLQAMCKHVERLCHWLAIPSSAFKTTPWCFLFIFCDDSIAYLVICT